MTSRLTTDLLLPPTPTLLLPRDCLLLREEAFWVNVGAAA